MSGDLVIFAPDQTITPNEVNRYMYASLAILAVITVGAVYFSRRSELLALLIAGFGFLSVFPTIRRRYPTRIEVNRRLRILKACYLTGGGELKEMYVRLENAVISYQPVSKGSDHFQVRISEKFMTTVLTVSYVTHYSEEQIRALYDVLAENRIA